MGYSKYADRKWKIMLKLYFTLLNHKSIKIPTRFAISCWSRICRDIKSGFVCDNLCNRRNIPLKLQWSFFLFYFFFYLKQKSIMSCPSFEVLSVFAWHNPQYVMTDVRLNWQTAEPLRRHMCTEKEENTSVSVSVTVRWHCINMLQRTTSQYIAILIICPVPNRNNMTTKEASDIICQSLIYVTCEQDLLLQAFVS